MKKYFRDHGRTIHVPRSLQDRAALVVTTQEELEQAQQRSPTVDEIALASGMDREAVLEASEVRRASVPESADAPFADHPTMTTLDCLGEDDRRIEQAGDRSMLAGAIQRLPQRERTIFLMRALEEMTQQEIAESIGISQMHVSRLLRRSRARLAAITQREHEIAS